MFSIIDIIIYPVLQFVNGKIAFFLIFGILYKDFICRYDSFIYLTCKPYFLKNI